MQKALRPDARRRAPAVGQAAERQYGAQSSETRLMHLGLVFSEDKRQFVAYRARQV
ncbi:MAG: hypothetical protein IJ164_09200 [Duodenibacillus sp.]|nr:hypothetical protein [Duodenibacillus sp.]